MSPASCHFLSCWSEYSPVHLVFRHTQSIILTLVSNGYETRSLFLREEQKFKLLENRFMRKIFGPKMEDVTGGCRKLFHEELLNFHSSSDIIRVIK
jgi:hypothetical protein